MLPKCQYVVGYRLQTMCGKPARFYTSEPVCTVHKKWIENGPGRITPVKFVEACHLCGLPLERVQHTDFFGQPDYFYEACKCFYCGYHDRKERLPCAND